MALDAYAAKAYWNLDSASMPYLKLAQERGLGQVDFSQVRARFIHV